MKKNLIYLDSKVLQQDMRIRLSKSILNNIDIIKGVTYFDILFDTTNNDIILRTKNVQEDSKDELHWAYKWVYGRK